MYWQLPEWSFQDMSPELKMRVLGILMGTERMHGYSPLSVGTCNLNLNLLDQGYTAQVGSGAER